MVDIAKIEKLMQLMSKHGFDVVQAESSGEKLSLARNASHAHIFQHAPHSSQQMSSSSPKNASIENLDENQGNSTDVSISTPVAKEEKAQPIGEVMTSPFVGTFYRSPSPDTPSFVEIGSKVKKGQALCIVEAMKLMNEIESEADGEVVAILVENAKPVEFGTPLFIIAPIK
ncbi:MAG: acetyl-CoA carboxylase biotin carboxyl carrier protein [Bdellovibrionota bacterium]